MPIAGSQKKPGPSYIPGSATSDKGSPQSDPLSGEGKDTQTSTHYPFRKENVSEDKSGRVIEGQKLRGYVHDDPGTNIGAVDDATVAPDGTRRVKKIG